MKHRHSHAHSLLPAYSSVSTVMAKVLLALVPAAVSYTWFFGIGYLLNFTITLIAGYVFEALALKARGKPIGFHLRDLSLPVTAALLSFALPPGSPWWIAVSGIFIAVIPGKHLFGGLGHNVFNPAALAYVTLLILFPLQMTGWYLPATANLPGGRIDPLSIDGMLTSLQLTFPFLRDMALTPFAVVPDGFATATPLIEYKFAAPARLLLADADGINFWDRGARTGWEVLSVGFVAGGIFLLWQRVISWHIPLTIIITVWLLANYFYRPGLEAIYGSPWLHLFGTSTMIGAFFIATDPVSSPTTALAKCIYGVLIGIVIYSIRVWGSYLDSVALGILFMNMFSPLLDQMIHRRPFGHKSWSRRWLESRRTQQ